MHCEGTQVPSSGSAALVPTMITKGDVLAALAQVRRVAFLGSSGLSMSDGGVQIEYLRGNTHATQQNRCQNGKIKGFRRPGSITTTDLHRHVS